MSSLEDYYKPGTPLDPHNLPPGLDIQRLLTERFELAPLADTGVDLANENVEYEPLHEALTGLLEQEAWFMAQQDQNPDPPSGKPTCVLHGF